MDLSKKKKIFQQYNTDPYIILNVSKRCTKQELDLNYQQAYSVLKRLPGQEAQIMLLKEAYKVVENDIHRENESQENYTMKKIDRIDQERSFHRTDFTDYNNRQSLFANDTLNFQKFEQELNNKKMTPMNKEYIPETIKGKMMFESGNFNIDTFNKKFEENFLRSDDDESPLETQGIDAFSSMSYMPICSYNGLIIEDKGDSIPFKNFQQLQTNNKESNIKKKSTKSKTKIKEEDVKKLYNKRVSETVSIDTTHNFSEINKIMEQKQLNNMKSQLEYNKDMIMKNISVFPNSIVEQFQMGVLEDSSTCIDGKNLVIPKGRRRD